MRLMQKVSKAVEQGYEREGSHHSVFDGGFESMIHCIPDIGSCGRVLQRC